MRKYRNYVSFFFFVFIFSVFISPLKVFAIDLTFSTPPSEISSDQEFTIDVTLSGVDEGKAYFIKGAFFQETGKYFGFTKNNNGELKSWSDDFSQMYKITGNQTIPITFKPDSASSNFKGTGQYSFRLKRITEGGTETWIDPMVTLTITESPLLTSTTTPTETPNIPNNITLSEIYAYPDSEGTEWVEIYNNNDQEVTLTDWKIRDAQNHEYVFSMTIPAKSLSVVEWSSSFLNNTTGDSVKLVTPTDFIVDEMSYSSCKTERSWIKHEGSWKETLTITKGNANSFSAPATDAPDPTNTLKPTSTTKPTSTPKPSATIKQTGVTPILDESGENILESTLSAIESSLSGLVLGTQTNDFLNLPSEENATEESGETNDNPKTAAIASLIIGGLIFTGIGGYSFWQWYMKHKV